MKNIYLAILLSAAFTTAFAGNPDRIGQAGATQLLINPWAGSSGLNNANVAGISGTEAMSLNPSGIINHNATEFAFSNCSWLSPSLGIKVNTFGFTRVIGKDKNDALGFTVGSMSFGDIPITTVQQPDNTIGTYNVSMFNLAIAYSHKFSDAIHAGVTVRSISEGLASVKTQGASLDAGIQYFAGKEDRMKFGISLRNVGPQMRYSGGVELPSMLHIGGSYDFFLGGDSAAEVGHVITLAGAFTSNAFDKDQGSFGLQYSFRRFLMLRAGYTYEDKIMDKTLGRKAYSGPSAGVSLDIPFTKDKARRFAIDYSFRAAAPFSGTHTIGARLLL
ncbi:MAG: PorV/PorQ family protein [Bacteroidetes bacterium]|nr:PorV/PorQ family protein [Bacteroidota bacterium]